MCLCFLCVIFHPPPVPHFQGCLIPCEASPSVWSEAAVMPCHFFADYYWDMPPLCDVAFLSDNKTRGGLLTQTSGGVLTSSPWTRGVCHWTCKHRCIVGHHLSLMITFISCGWSKYWHTMKNSFTADQRAVRAPSYPAVPQLLWLKLWIKIFDSLQLWLCILEDIPVVLRAPRKLIIYWPIDFFIKWLII